MVIIFVIRFVATVFAVVKLLRPIAATHRRLVLFLFCGFRFYFSFSSLVLPSSLTPSGTCTSHVPIHAFLSSVKLFWIYFRFIYYLFSEVFIYLQYILLASVDFYFSFVLLSSTTPSGTCPSCTYSRVLPSVKIYSINCGFVFFYSVDF